MADLAGTGGVPELRAALHEEMRAQRAVWCRLKGLSAGRSADHRGLLHLLNNLGFGGAFTRFRPHTLVLDWSGVDRCTADGLAFFSVLVRVLMDAGIRVVVCEPEDGNIASVLDHSGLRAACGQVEWIPCACSRPRGMKVLAPTAVFGGSAGRGNVEEFQCGLDDALDLTGLEADLAGLLSAISMDLIQNIRSHAGKAYASAVAFLDSRRRPPVVEIGMADAGEGIASHLLSQERHSGLLPYSDTAVLEAVFRRALSGRAGDSGGGGLSRLIGRLRESHEATVVVRSGAGLVTFSGSGSNTCASERLTYGWGTQTLIAVRVEH